MLGDQALGKPSQTQIGLLQGKVTSALFKNVMIGAIWVY
jgi:hypothetical protein